MKFTIHKILLISLLEQWPKCISSDKSDISLTFIVTMVTKVVARIG